MVMLGATVAEHLTAIRLLALIDLYGPISEEYLFELAQTPDDQLPLPGTDVAPDQPKGN